MTHRILIVGATGPLGNAIRNELAAFGHTVSGISRSARPHEERLDASDPVATLEYLQRMQPATVLYLARPDLDSMADAEQAIERAVNSLLTFGNQCINLGVSKLVFASSAAVYGTGRRSPLREQDSPSPMSPYGRLKLRSEQALRELAESRGLSVTVLRIFNVYGPGFSSSLINRLVLGDSEPPIVYDTRDFVRDYIHASDVARGFRLAVETPKLEQTVLNLGTGVATDNCSLLALFPSVAYRRQTASDVMSYSVADISRIREQWSFEPRFSIDDALASPELLL